MKPFGVIREAFEADRTALSDDSRVAGRSPIARFIDIMDKVSFALSEER